MTELREKINNIVEEKNTKVLPENIKAGTQIFNVTGTFTNDATATETDILLGKTAYVNGEKLTGTYEVIGEEITITPSNVEQIEEGLFSKVTVAGDSDLVPENIKKGINIFGVEGSLESSKSSYNALIFPNPSVSTTFTVGKCITEIGDLDVTGCTSFNSAFTNCGNLKKIGLLKNTNQVTNWNSAFSGTTSLTIIPHIDVSKATTAQYMFQNSGVVEFEQEELNFDNLTSSCMSFFNGCNNLKRLPRLSFLKATTFNNFCGNCKSLEEVTYIYAPKATNWNQAFYGCMKLVRVEGMDFSNCTMINTLFYNCSSLKYVQAIQAGKMKLLRDAVFTACRVLEEFGGMIDLGKAYTQKTANYTDYTFSLSESLLLTHESLMNVINKLYDLNITYNVAGGGTLYTQKLMLGSTNLAKLTAEEIRNSYSKADGPLVNNRKEEIRNEVFQLH